jgi:ferrous iron transport protein A
METVMLKSSPLCLSDLPTGVCARITGLGGESNICCRLREFGLCETALIERISGAATMLCQVGSSRIALSRQIADFVQVELVGG